MMRLPSSKFAAALFLCLFSLLPALAGGLNRYASFEQVSREQRHLGDGAGAELLKRIGADAPSIPPELSSDIRSKFRDYAAKYDAFRSRIGKAFIYPNHPASDAWRLDRAEADLHLVAYEMTKMDRAAISLIQKYLIDAGWALDHGAIKIGMSDPPPTITADISPSVINAGDQAVITWRITYAERARLDGAQVSLEGSTLFYPDESREYLIEAFGKNAKTEQRLAVTVLPAPPPEIVFTAEPTVSAPCAPITLRWSVARADEAVLDGEPVELSGVRTVYPCADAQYKLAARGRGGVSAALVEVAISEAAPELELSVSPSSIIAGETAILRWRAFGANYVSIASGSSHESPLPVRGSKMIAPTATAVYEAEAVGPGGKTHAAAAVRVAESAPRDAHASSYSARVYFAFNSDIVTQEFADTLAKTAAAFKASAHSFMRIEGYADALGSESYNAALSMKRAIAVKKVLVDRYGVSPARIKVEARGEARPIAPNEVNGADNPAGRNLNRRAEIIFE